MFSKYLTYTMLLGMALILSTCTPIRTAPVKEEPKVEKIDPDAELIKALQADMEKQVAYLYTLPQPIIQILHTEDHKYYCVVSNDPAIQEALGSLPFKDLSILSKNISDLLDESDLTGDELYYWLRDTIIEGAEEAKSLYGEEF